MNTLNPALRKERIGWYFYDFANSAFATSVVLVFLGPYLTVLANAAADTEGNIHPFGITVSAGAFFAYVVSLSVFLQVFFLPILGALADYSRRKKEFMGIAAYIGAAATMGLYFIGKNYLVGAGLFMLANVAFGASIIFYNAFLSDIASAEERDSVSSVGWGVGYIGGGLLLFLNLVLLMNAGALGLSTEHAVRIAIVSAGLWWAIFTLVPLVTLKNRGMSRSLPHGAGYVRTGFSQLGRTLKDLRRYPHTLLFLTAFLLYNDGIQTVIYTAGVYGTETLGITSATLALVILVVQFVAFFGALVFNAMAKYIGAKKTVLLTLVIWTGAVTYAWQLLHTVGDFWMLSIVIALVLGGSQALSCSLFSQMIPKGQEAEFFSFYEISDKGTSWFGPLVFGLAYQFTRDYRIAIFSLVIFFAVGFTLLLFVNVRKAALEARHDAVSQM